MTEFSTAKILMSVYEIPYLYFGTEKSLNRLNYQDFTTVFCEDV